METLQAIYDSEINVRISWMWDGGIDVELGGLPGYNEQAPKDAETTVKTMAEAENWLIQNTIEHYPNSVFAKNIEEEKHDAMKALGFDGVEDSLDDLTIRRKP